MVNDILQDSYHFLNKNPTLVILHVHTIAIHSYHIEHRFILTLSLFGSPKAAVTLRYGQLWTQCPSLIAWRRYFIYKFAGECRNQGGPVDPVSDFIM